MLLGNVGGSFQAAVNYPAGGSATGAAVGDFNGDGKADLAVGVSAGFGNGSLAILLGNGDGTFQAPVLWSVTGASPVSVAVADLNGDGKADIVTANFGNNEIQDYGSLSVLLGNGDGTFQPAVKYTVGSGPSSIVVGDFNWDGKADLAVASVGLAPPRELANGSVSVLLGNGNGTFQAAVTYDNGFLAPPVYGITAADFNGDGVLDLAIASSGNVGIHIGNGDGTFQAVATYPSPSPVSLVAGDFNGDGETDLAMADIAGAGILLAVQNLPTPPCPSFSGQVNGGSGTLYLQFPNGTPFGYFVNLGNNWIFHADLGYEYFAPGNDAADSIYMWDLQSGHWFYTSPAVFPFLYDFTLKAWLYYFPNSSNERHYLTNPRYFENVTTGQEFAM